MCDASTLSDEDKDVLVRGIQHLVALRTSAGPNASFADGLLRTIATPQDHPVHMYLIALAPDTIRDLAVKRRKCSYIGFSKALPAKLAAHNAGRPVHKRTAYAHGHWRLAAVFVLPIHRGYQSILLRCILRQRFRILSKRLPAMLVMGLLTESAVWIADDMLDSPDWAAEEGMAKLREVFARDRAKHPEAELSGTMNGVDGRWVPRRLVERLYGKSLPLYASRLQQGGISTATIDNCALAYDADQDDGELDDGDDSGSEGGLGQSEYEPSDSGCEFSDDGSGSQMSG